MRSENESIHPSAYRPVKNTSKPWRRQGKGKLGKKQARLNARRNAHSATIRGIKQPLAYKTPGSMK
jgi:hypothetical protein